MTDKSEINTFIILKYGSMDHALNAFLANSNQFTTEECHAMDKYSKTIFNNIIFAHLNGKTD